MEKKLEEKKDIALGGKILPADIKNLCSNGAIHELKISGPHKLTVKLAQLLPKLPLVEQLWLSCDVTRKAMRHVIQVPGLRVLDILAIEGPGRLEAFSEASSLEICRANHYLTDVDVTAILQAPSLLELGIQGASLSPQLIRMILAHPQLAVLDFERTAFDDSMAKTLSASKRIHTLYLGSTKITGKGVRYLSRMTQLKALDLWATQVTLADLDWLTRLPQLEYLSLGNFDGMPGFDAAHLIPRLEALACLTNIWLDGIKINEQQAARLRSRIARVNINS